MKRCSKCGEVKPRTEFHRNRTSKSGLQAYCRACSSVAIVTWYAANGERQRENNRRSRRRARDVRDGLVTL